MISLSLPLTLSLSGTATPSELTVKSGSGAAKQLCLSSGLFVIAASVLFI